MSDTVLYLSQSAITGLELDPTLAREAVRRAFKGHHAGRESSKPKLVLEIGPGHAFQSLCAASSAMGMAGTKWLGMAPTPGAAGGAHIDALIALNDFSSGRLLAILDGNVLTGIRTAAMSAAAAAGLARHDSKTIGFIGCGLQARAHLAALKALLPGLSTVLAFGKGRESSERFAAYARGTGLSAVTLEQAEAVVRGSDVLVTSVPMRPGFAAFLDPDWVPAGGFVTAVDIARSWFPETLRQLDVLVTDDHRQQAEAPPFSASLGAQGSFDADLSELAAGARPGRATPQQRAMFIFRGFALADLAVAACVYEAALAKGVGLILPR